MNQNTIEALFASACVCFDRLHALRESIYMEITVPDDGELTELPSPIKVIPHSNEDVSNFQIEVTHAYNDEGILSFLHEDLRVCANLIPIECMVPLGNKVEIEKQLGNIRFELFDLASRMIEAQQGDVYFELCNDSRECLRLNGSYLNVTTLSMHNNKLLVSGTDDNDTPESCVYEEIFIEDFCGLLIGHLGELEEQ